MNEFLSTYSKYGINALFVVAIGYLQLQLNKQEAKLERVEFQLYDCLRQPTATISQSKSQQDEKINDVLMVAVLENKRRYIAGQWKVVG